MQLESGSVVGLSRKALMMLLGQSPLSFTEWPVPGNSKKKLWLRVCAASCAQATGVTGSYSPDSSSVGTSLVTASASIGGAGVTSQILQVSSIDCTFPTINFCNS